MLLLEPVVGIRKDMVLNTDVIVELELGKKNMKKIIPHRRNRKCKNL